MPNINALEKRKQGWKTLRTKLEKAQNSKSGKKEVNSGDRTWTPDDLDTVEREIARLERKIETARNDVSGTAADRMSELEKENEELRKQLETGGEAGEQNAGDNAENSGSGEGENSNSGGSRGAVNTARE